ncbi:hypothetical protein [Streptomyces mobaraensis]|uniref:hypothetical protein n=1 Tax=Streptomyces mobaraensis TaxID=35621 RepID=UPI0033D70E03
MRWACRRPTTMAVVVVVVVDRAPFPALIVSPAPGRITQEREVTDPYRYDPMGSASPGGYAGEQSSAGQPGAGPVGSTKDTLGPTVQSTTSGVSSTVNAALRQC